MHLASFGDSGTAGESACKPIRYFSPLDIAAGGFQIEKTA